VTHHFAAHKRARRRLINFCSLELLWIIFHVSRASAFLVSAASSPSGCTFRYIAKDWIWIISSTARECRRCVNARTTKSCGFLERTWLSLVFETAEMLISERTHPGDWKCIKDASWRLCAHGINYETFMKVHQRMKILATPLHCFYCSRLFSCKNWVVN
jgi:hypothetical protein